MSFVGVQNQISKQLLSAERKPRMCQYKQVSQYSYCTSQTLNQGVLLQVCSSCLIITTVFFMANVLRHLPAVRLELKHCIRSIHDFHYSINLRFQSKQSQLCPFFSLSLPLLQSSNSKIQSSTCNCLSLKKIKDDKNFVRSKFVLKYT